MASHFEILCVIVLNKSGGPRLSLLSLDILLMKKSPQISKVEPEKILAERINGWAAMMGFWAAVGAYLTTGQLIPGVV